MAEQIKISRYNYEEMMPNAEMKFASLIQMAYCPYRDGHIGNGHFGMNRYLYFDDIISLMERKIRSASGASVDWVPGTRTRQNIAKWNKMLETAMKNKNIQANKAKEN